MIRPPLRATTWLQSLAEGLDEEPSLLVSPPTVSSFKLVKVIGLAAVPWAFNVPYTSKRMLLGLIFTTVPAGRVSVAPLLTDRPLTTYGNSGMNGRVCVSGVLLDPTPPDKPRPLTALPLTVLPLT